MIRSFRDKRSLALFEGQRVRAFDAFRRQAERRLQMLDAAVALEDLARISRQSPGGTAGDRQGQHSIRVNMRWRVCFTWKDDGAYDVEIVDYH